MLKIGDSLKNEADAVEALRHVLAEVPELTVVAVNRGAESAESSVDFIVHLSFHGQPRTLVGEVKASGQPRHVKSALFQLQQYAEAHPGPVTPVLVAPYLSEDARALCITSHVGYLDFQGNARIVFPGFFMSRSVAGKPAAEQRALRALFKPKSAAVMRALLSAPGKHWRLAQLAAESHVSLGHVSNVRNSLVERGWAEVTSEGLYLRDPDGLLDAWRADYAPPSGERLTFYTTLHGAAFEDALRSSGAAGADGRAILASFSAANWLAPYARTGTHWFYATHEGADQLRKQLNLTATTRGENVAITVTDDIGVFHDAIQPTQGIHCTSAVQTYLDLCASGERGREAAEHLRREKLRWHT